MSYEGAPPRSRAASPRNADVEFRGFRLYGYAFDPDTPFVEIALVIRRWGTGAMQVR